MKCIISCLVTLLITASSFAKSPTVALYKILRDGQQRDTTIVHLQRQKDGGYLLRVPQSELRKLEYLHVVPSMAVGHQGENGYFITNSCTQVKFNTKHPVRAYKRQWEETYLRGDALKDFSDGIQFTIGWDEGVLCMSGYRQNNGKLWMAVKEGLKFESRQHIKLLNGEYSLIDAYYLKDIESYEDLTILYYPVKGSSYTDIALKYREWLLAHNRLDVPLRQKVATRPEIAYCADAPEVRIRMAWKESPSPVLEQTRENEPPMHIAVTFDRVCEIIDALVAKGVKKAEICLVGWNISGHDGRFPEILPPEPKLGGYAGLRKVIAKANEVGYRIDLHTCRTDIYSICEDWQDGYHVALSADGSMQSKFVYGGGKMYNICLKQSYEKFFKRDEPKLAALGLHGMHYIDVLSIINPHDCHHPEHPINKKQGAEYICKMMDDSRQLFGGCQSEGCKDWTAKYLDCGLYTSCELHRPEKSPIFDAYLPIWHIVFNGYIMSNPANSTVNFTIKPVEDAMRMQEYAGRPAFYIHSSFKADKKADWMGGVLDLRCGTDAELEETVTQIKKGCDLFEEYKHLLFETMDKHEELAPKVFCSTFSNGERMICNYSDTPYTYKKATVKPKSFLLLK